MVQLTLISRVHDGLILAEDLDNEKDKELGNYKAQAKVTLLSFISAPPHRDTLYSPIQRFGNEAQACKLGERCRECIQLPCLNALNVLQTLFKKMEQERSQNSRMSVDAGHFVFHYMIADDVCYLTLTEAKYPKKLAYQYLDELHSEFMNLFRTQIQSAARPYAFVKFGEPFLLSCWLISSTT